MNVGLQFLSVTWTDGIPDNEAIMILRDIHFALRQALKFLPANNPIRPVQLPEVKPFGYWVLQDSDPDSLYGSAAWYMDRSYDSDQGYLCARRYLNLVVNEPFQHHSPHYDLAIVHYPLYDETEEREVMGVGIAGLAAITSTAWLKRLSIRDERPIVLRRLVSHYLGAVIGIPSAIHDDLTICNGPCAMRPAHELSDWLNFAQEESDANTIYCESCRRQLSARIASNQLGLN